MPPTAPATDPKTITAGQLQSLSIVLSEMFGTDRDAQHGWINTTLGSLTPPVPPIESRKDLSEDQARVLIAKAKREKTSKAAEREHLAREEAKSQPQVAPDGSTVIESTEERGLRTVEALRAAAPVTVADHDVTRQPPVQEAVRRVMEAVGKVGVEKRGEFSDGRTSYNFRGIDHFVDTLSPILAQHGVILLPNVGKPRITEHATRSGGRQFMVVVRVKWTIVGPAGDTMKAVTLGQALDSSDKAGNKAMSAAFKYALGQIFVVPNIGWQEQDAERPEVAAEPQRPLPPSEEEQAERWQILARLQAIASETGSTFEAMTNRKRSSLGGLTVDEFRNGPVGGLRAYLDQCEAYLVQRREREAAEARAAFERDARETPEEQQS